MTGWAALIAVILLIAANGLFVAAEFALVAVRRGAIEERAERGERRAKVVLATLHDLSFVLSSAQFGITATSLLVGFLAEDAVGDVLVVPALEAVGLSDASGPALSVAIAFVLSTGVQMVVGELFPKNLAISEPEATALATATPMRWFGIVLGPVIRVFDGAAARLTNLVGIEAGDELDNHLSRDELARIIEASGQQGALTETQAELLQRAVSLGERRAGEIMVPRPDVVWLGADATLEDLRLASRRTGYSRFPVRGATDDEVLGTVHLKDLLDHPVDARATTPVAAVATTPLLVPESELVGTLLARMRRGRRTFAVVVDEYGGTAGIATLEDVLEALVGSIEDEFDREVARVRRIGPGRFTVQGGLRSGRLKEVLGIDLGQGEFETVAGFVLDRLGHIPEPGESVDHDGWRFEVTALEGVRIASLRVWRLPAVAGEDAGPDGVPTTEGAAPADPSVSPTNQGSGDAHDRGPAADGQGDAP